MISERLHKCLQTHYNRGNHLIVSCIEHSAVLKTAVANPFGSGVLENPGLLPFMPNLAHYFLGEVLILPTATTWWCGQPQELNNLITQLMAFAGLNLEGIVYGGAQSELTVDVVRLEHKIEVK